MPPHTKLTRHTEFLSTAQDKEALDHGKINNNLKLVMSYIINYKFAKDYDHTLIGVNGKGNIWKDTELFADDQDFRNAQIASLGMYSDLKFHTVLNYNLNAANFMSSCYE